MACADRASYAAGDVPDYQMAALLMAVFFRGLDRDETAALTEAMLRSGARSTRPISTPASTSTRPAAWATRCRSCSRRCRRAAASRCR